MIVLAHSWQSLRDTFPGRRLEWAAATMLTLLGIVFFLNEDMFAGSNAWQHMAEFWPQYVWAWGCAAVGSARLITLVVNGAFSRSPHARAVLAFISCFGWYQLTVGLLPNLAIGAAIFPVLLFFDAGVALQVIKEAGLAEAQIERTKKSGTSS